MSKNRTKVDELFPVSQHWNSEGIRASNIMTLADLYEGQDFKALILYRENTIFGQQMGKNNRKVYFRFWLELNKSWEIVTSTLTAREGYTSESKPE